MANNKPIVDKKAVLDQIKTLEKQLDELTPHVNTAVAAFGDQSNLQARVTDLRNMLAKAKAAYSA